MLKRLYEMFRATWVIFLIYLIIYSLLEIF